MKCLDRTCRIARGWSFNRDMRTTLQYREARFNELDALAKSKGGECLSTIYIHAQSKLRWRCVMGHDWEATPNSVINIGTWCGICGHERQKRAKTHTIEMMHRVAREKDGECLSTIYIQAHSKLRWRCSIGHEWEATPANIKHGQWCSICSQGISERICRAILEQITEVKFPKCRCSKTKAVSSVRRDYR